MSIQYTGEYMNHIDYTNTDGNLPKEYKKNKTKARTEWQDTDEGTSNAYRISFFLNRLSISKNS